MTPDVIMTYPRAVAVAADRFVRDAAPPEEGGPRKAAAACPCVAAGRDGDAHDAARTAARERVRTRLVREDREAKIGAVFDMQPAPGEPDERARVSDSTT
jgi:hypothetical protein